MDTKMDTTVEELETKYTCKDFNDISKCFALLHVRLNDMFKDLDSRVSNLEANKDAMDSVISEITEVDIPAIDHKLNALNVEALKRDIWSRKWNLKFKGVAGESHERADVTEVKAREFLKEKLRVEDADMINFQAVHRLKGGPKGKKNIIARFVRLSDTDKAMEGIKYLPPDSGYSVQRDLPPQIDELRNQLLKERSKMDKDLKSRTRLVHLKEPPFLKLVTKQRF
jgi:hypothetical protein